MNTVSGHRGMMLEEALIFEQDSPGAVGVDLPEPDEDLVDRLGGLERTAPIGLPDLAEPTVVRHYTRLSQKNFGIDSVFYPLGSCTMKHNPRLNERMARLAGLADIHPFQPPSTVQGALALIDACAHWLKTLTGMPVIAMSPAAGAHGEFCGLMTIRAALDARGEQNRRRVLVPESAHGTNPASAAACGFTVDAIPANARGRVDLAALKSKLGPDVAAFMLTNPNTCGLFENEVLEIADAVHKAGAFFYGDGANFNALVGRVRIADLGVDVMHINLHKTFSTPHGGGGPGSGPTVLSAELGPFAPLPTVIHDDKGYRLIEHANGADARAVDARPVGRIKGYHGQFGTFVRALTYMMSMGSDGLRQASSDAVLAANYVLAELSGDLTAPFAGPCMHEALFDDRFLKDTHVSTLDVAKALIDEGFHPMTMYFPLVVSGALLIEPTETESKSTLDRFIGSLRALAKRAKAGDAESFHAAPTLTPRRRLDETAAARQPVLRWKPEPEKKAAE
jgi:glycine dehydrogenase subunit 2